MNCTTEQRRGLALPLVITFALIMFLVGSAAVALTVNHLNLVSKQQSRAELIEQARAGVAEAQAELDQPLVNWNSFTLDTAANCVDTSQHVGYQLHSLSYDPVSGTYWLTSTAFHSDGNSKPLDSLQIKAGLRRSAGAFRYPLLAAGAITMDTASQVLDASGLTAIRTNSVLSGAISLSGTVQGDVFVGPTLAPLNVLSLLGGRVSGSVLAAPSVVALSPPVAPAFPQQYAAPPMPAGPGGTQTGIGGMPSLGVSAGGSASAQGGNVSVSSTSIISDNEEGDSEGNASARGNVTSTNVSSNGAGLAANSAGSTAGSASASSNVSFSLGGNPPPITGTSGGVGSNSSSSITVTGQQTLDPMKYSTLDVAAGGVATLAPGTYEFDNIVVDAGGTLVVPSGAQVVIYLTGTMTSLGTITNSGAPQNLLILGVQGATSIAIDNGKQVLSAAIYAPTAILALTGTTMSGSLVGLAINLVGSTMQYVSTLPGFTFSGLGSTAIVSWQEP